MAATLAAGVAFGVGVALVRSGTRRARPAPPREPPQLGLLAGEPPGRGLRRMTIEQADLAISLLEDTEGALRPEAVHEVRKALKRMRALLRLLRGELRESTFAQENHRLRDLGRRLAGARDAEVLLDTLRALMERHPRRLRRSGITRLERRLVLEREAVRARVLTDAAMRVEVIAELRAFRARAASWQPGERDPRFAETGMRRVYRTGRRRYRRAERGKGKRTRTLHRWRKSVKDLRYSGEALGPRRSTAAVAAEPEAAGNGPPAGAPARAGNDAGRHLRRLARRADRLAEMLGEEHDLAVLAELVASGRAPLGVKLSRRTRKRLLKAIAGRRRELRVRALSAGDTLYDRRPKRMLRVVRAELRARPLS